jgi:hypothetical protein
VFIGPYGVEGAKQAPAWMRKVVIDTDTEVAS